MNDTLSRLRDNEGYCEIAFYKSIQPSDYIPRFIEAGWCGLHRNRKIYHLVGQFGTKSEIVEALRRVLKSLEYIHSSGYIHGDVIAENVLVSGNKVVLGDFGWAKNIGTEWFNRIDHDLLAYERIMIRLITGQWYNYDMWFTLRDGPNETLMKKIPMDDVIERYLKNLWNGDLYQLD